MDGYNEMDDRDEGDDGHSSPHFPEAPQEFQRVEKIRQLLAVYRQPPSSMPVAVVESRSGTMTVQPQESCDGSSARMTAPHAYHHQHHQHHPPLMNLPEAVMFDGGGAGESGQDAHGRMGRSQLASPRMTTMSGGSGPPSMSMSARCSSRMNPDDMRMVENKGLEDICNLVKVNDPKPRSSRNKLVQPPLPPPTAFHIMAPVPAPPPLTSRSQPPPLSESSMPSLAERLTLNGRPGFNRKLLSTPRPTHAISGQRQPPDEEVAICRVLHRMMSNANANVNNNVNHHYLFPGETTSSRLQGRTVRSSVSLRTQFIPVVPPSEVTAIPRTRKSSSRSRQRQHQHQNEFLGRGEMYDPSFAYNSQPRPVPSHDPATIWPFVPPPVATPNPSYPPQHQAQASQKQPSSCYCEREGGDLNHQRRKQQQEASFPQSRDSIPLKLANKGTSINLRQESSDGLGMSTSSSAATTCIESILPPAANFQSDTSSIAQSTVRMPSIYILPKLPTSGDMPPIVLLQPSQQQQTLDQKSSSSKEPPAPIILSPVQCQYYAVPSGPVPVSMPSLFQNQFAVFGSQLQQQQLQIQMPDSPKKVEKESSRSRQKQSSSGRHHHQESSKSNGKRYYYEDEDEVTFVVGPSPVESRQDLTKSTHRRRRDSNNNDNDESPRRRPLRLKSKRSNKKVGFPIRLKGASYSDTQLHHKLQMAKGKRSLGRGEGRHEEEYETENEEVDYEDDELQLATPTTSSHTITIKKHSKPVIHSPVNKGRHSNRGQQGKGGLRRSSNSSIEDEDDGLPGTSRIFPMDEFKKAMVMEEMWNNKDTTSSPRYMRDRIKAEDQENDRVAEKGIAEGMVLIEDSNSWERNVCGLRVISHHVKLNEGAVVDRLPSIVSAIQRHIKASGSKLARQAILTLKDLFTVLGPHFDAFLTSLADRLFAKMANTNKFIKDDCEATLGAMVTYCSHPKMIQIFHNVARRHKHQMIRLVACRMITKFIAIIGAETILNEYAEFVLPLLGSNLVERSGEIRDEAKKALKLMVSNKQFDQCMRDYVQPQFINAIFERLERIRDEANDKQRPSKMKIGSTRSLYKWQQQKQQQQHDHQ